MDADRIGQFNAATEFSFHLPERLAVQASPYDRNDVKQHQLAFAEFTAEAQTGDLFFLLALTAEAARVIEIRTKMMALGRATPAEMRLMVTEKVEALEYALGIMIRGGDAALVIDNYRGIVAANVARLTVER